MIMGMSAEEKQRWKAISFKGASIEALMELIGLIRTKTKDWAEKKELVERYWNKWVKDNQLDFRDEIDDEYNYRRQER